MKVADLLTDESKWCRLNLALDCQGEFVDPLSRRAVRWCIYGAIERCYRGKNRHIARHILSGLVGNVSIFNDMHTFADIRRVIEQAGV